MQKIPDDTRIHINIPKMNNRERMYETNSAIKKALIKRGFHSLYLFPHLRFCKDYHLEGFGFDAMGFTEHDSFIYLFQFKTNCKPTKDELQKFKEIEAKYFVKCCWANKPKRKPVEFYC